MFWEFLIGRDKGGALYPDLARRAFLAGPMLNLRTPFHHYDGKSVASCRGSRAKANNAFAISAAGRR